MKPNAQATGGVTPATRLAPSPTGALHLGNARTFLAGWAVARRSGWRVLLRIDDLEGPRVKPGAAAEAVEDLKWLGLTWDEDAVYQSTRVARYDAALGALRASGRTYFCSCTRSQIARDSPGTSPDGAAIYGGHCRGTTRKPGVPASERFAMKPGTIRFEDAVAGEVIFDGKALGDPVVRKVCGEIAYHLATVVDDAELGITHVIRGADLLASTPRQMALQAALNLPGPVYYAHLPLVTGPDGRKLAKRHGDTRLSTLRAEGVSPGRVRRMLARWSGFDLPEEASAREWAQAFEPDRLPREPVVYDDATDRPAGGAT